MRLTVDDFRLLARNTRQAAAEHSVPRLRVVAERLDALADAMEAEEVYLWLEDER